MLPEEADITLFVMSYFQVLRPFLQKSLLNTSCGFTGASFQASHRVIKGIRYGVTVATLVRGVERYRTRIAILPELEWRNSPLGARDHAPVAFRA